MDRPWPSTAPKKLGPSSGSASAWVALNILAAIWPTCCRSRARLTQPPPSTPGQAPSTGSAPTTWGGTSSAGGLRGAGLEKVGFGGMAIGLLLGGTFGLFVRLPPGPVDTVMNAASYVLLAFPALVAVIAMVTFWGHDLWKIIFIIGLAGAPLIFRISAPRPCPSPPATSSRGQGPRRQDSRILTGDPAQHRADDVSFSLIGVAGHRLGGLAGLPRPVGPTAHAVVGEHAQREPQGSTTSRPEQSLAGALPGPGHVPLPARDQPGRRPAAPALRRDGRWHRDAPGDDREPGHWRWRDLRTSFTTDRGPCGPSTGSRSPLGQGQTLGIVGESGSGKTVLSRRSWGCSGATRAAVGSVRFEGRDSWGPRRSARSVWGARIAMVFQDPMTSLNPVMRIGRQITESLRLHLGLDRAEARAHRRLAAHAGGHPRARERYGATRASSRAACASG